MNARQIALLVVATLAIAPLCLLLFGGGDEVAAGRTVARTTKAPAKTVDAGCVERALAYGLTNDQTRGRELQKMILSPFVDHPPMPPAGFYGSGEAPDENTLLHAIYHGYVVVRYRPDVEATVKRALEKAGKRAHQPVVFVAGQGMPFAVGTIVYGRSSICGKLDRATLAQLRGWIERAEPHRTRL